MSVMVTEAERNWTAHLVISSDHAGLRPFFKRLESEILHALARIDNPRIVKTYLEDLRKASQEWRSDYPYLLAKK